MGAAIVLAAVLSLAVSSLRNRPDEPELPVGGEVVMINNQPITLRRNPALTVQLAPPEVPTAPVIENEQPTTEPATAVPEPTATPEPENNTVVDPTATPVPAQPTVNAVILESYVVQAGDTLYRITTQKATSIALMAEYGISQDSLSPGETISVPVGNPAFCPGRRPYAVGEDETVFSIAQKTNTTKKRSTPERRCAADRAGSRSAWPGV